MNNYLLSIIIVIFPLFLVSQEPYMEIENNVPDSEIFLTLGMEKPQNVLGFDLYLDLTNDSLLKTSARFFERNNNYFPEKNIANQNINSIIQQKNGLIRLVALAPNTKINKEKEYIGKFKCRVNKSIFLIGESQEIKLYGQIHRKDDSMIDIAPVSEYFKIVPDPTSSAKVKIIVSPSISVKKKRRKKIKIKVTDNHNNSLSNKQLTFEVNSPRIILENASSAATNKKGEYKLCIKGKEQGEAIILISADNGSTVQKIIVKVL